MKLYNLSTLADALGMSCKALCNRIDHDTGNIVVAGKLIQAHKERGVWLIWCDVAYWPDVPNPSTPTLPKVSTTKGKAKRVQFFIDASKSGRG